jgi:hypothetical protein
LARPAKVIQQHYSVARADSRGIIFREHRLSKQYAPIDEQITITLRIKSICHAEVVKHGVPAFTGASGHCGKSPVALPLTALDMPSWKRRKGLLKRFVDLTLTEILHDIKNPRGKITVADLELI